MATPRTEQPASINSAIAELSPGQLRRRCDPATLSLDTAAAPARQGLLGQGRASEALALALAMTEPSFNVYASGPRGAGKTTAVRAALQDVASRRPVPSDWCYIHNFADPARPRVLQLAAGRGSRLRDDMRGLVQAARAEITRAFESEEYLAQREAIVDALNHRREQSVAELTGRAQRAGFQLQFSPAGMAVIPMLGNRPLTEADFAGPRPEMRAEIDKQREAVDADIHAFLKAMRAAERETREQLAAQDREVALHAVGGLVDDLAENYLDQPAVATYLRQVREGILEDIALFRGHPGVAQTDASQDAAETAERAVHERAFRKYAVNVIVDNGAATGAPVVFEQNPTYPNVIGRIEREALFGALVTDFTLISPGALHRANGGYLMLNAIDLLRAPAAWEALKRALRGGAIMLEDVSDVLGLSTTRSLRPDPIPLDVKVVLIGDAPLYALLRQADPDFRELFKVRADFDSLLEWTAENASAYAGFLQHCVDGGERPIDRSGLARLIEESARLAGDQHKLSARLGELADLAREAGYYAAQAGAAAIDAEHVRRAAEQRTYRAALAAERVRDAIARDVLLVQPRGTAVGQLHGLAVVGDEDVPFGVPERITASVAAGRDGVVDIERQVELGGPIHSKGVLILSGYLAGRYARARPLGLSARLVFEQSYGPVEGDSASLAELLTLLSAIGEIPLRQDLAVTGSVNQHGVVQAVGGVTEKIEGFFDACAAVGLTGSQGVVLPAANVQHLMLRDDVVEAVSAGRFHVYAVASVDEAISALSGLEPGHRDHAGGFPAESFHGRVDRRLAELAEALRAFAEPSVMRTNGHRRRVAGVTAATGLARASE